MSVFSRFVAALFIASKRLLAQPGLSLATLTGLVSAISLTISIPVYTNAVFNRVLREELASSQDSFAARRPPFSFLFGFFGSVVETKEWEDIQRADAYLSEAAARDLGLPLIRLVRSFQTDNFQLFGQTGSAYGENPLDWVSFGYLSDLEDQITLVEGSFPNVAEASAESPVGVMISAALAEKLGVQVGEIFTTYRPQTTGEISQLVQFTVQISGIWEPIDPQDIYWFTNPASFDKVLFVPQETLGGQLAGSMKGDIYTANWYLVMDGSGIDAAHALPLLNRIRMVRNQASRLLPQTILMTSPEEALQKYQGLNSQLSFTLYAYTLPILALLLSFISLVVGLAVGEQHNEIAMMRSRGSTFIQVIVIAGLQALVLGALALIISMPVGMLVSGLIGKTRSFLDFSATNDLHITLPQTAVQTGLLLVGLTILAQVGPTISAARYTVITYKQERARVLRPPWWQRLWLDVALMIPTAYGIYMLQQQGNIAILVSGMEYTHDPFQNPLLFLVPTLGIFSLTLFVIRILPLFMRLLAWLSARTRSVGFLLAAQHLSRTPGFYTAPMVLLVLTLSLSSFTASLGKTLDRHLVDQIYYRVGADASLQDLGEQFGGTPNGSSLGSQAGMQWFFLPVTEYLKLPGVKAAARLGVYTANVYLGAGTVATTLYGVDRVDFRRVAFWRSDFASLSLGKLMNRLAVEPSGVLVSRGLVQQYGLVEGDNLRLSLYADAARHEVILTIVGVFDLFPTWIPSEKDKYLLVGNLENIYEQVGMQLPYHVWLRTDRNLDYTAMSESAANVGLSYIGLKDSPARIAKEQERPERQGLFGVLSVGFMAGAFLTVLGFMLYALFSFRNRFIELGVLRAIGLSAGQMISFLAWELAFLLLIGSVAGTGLGIWVSQLFIPYLQIGSDAAAQVPSFQVIIAWPEIFRIYSLFGVLFLGALGALGTLLMRMKIFQAIKLGETV